MDIIISFIISYQNEIIFLFYDKCESIVSFKYKNMNLPQIYTIDQYHIKSEKLELRKSSDEKELR